MCVELHLAPMHLLPTEGPVIWDAVTNEMVLVLERRAEEHKERETRERLRAGVGSG